MLICKRPACGDSREREQQKTIGKQIRVDLFVLSHTIALLSVSAAVAWLPVCLPACLFASFQIANSPGVHTHCLACNIILVLVLWMCNTVRAKSNSSVYFYLGALWQSFCSSLHISLSRYQSCLPLCLNLSSPFSLALSSAIRRSFEILLSIFVVLFLKSTLLALQAHTHSNLVLAR